MQNRVLITGASSGLGRELFKRFWTMGWDVTGTTLGGDCRVVPGSRDLIEYDAMESPLQVSGSLGGPVDVLINNAGINAIKPFEELDPFFIGRIMRINFVAPVLLTQHLLTTRRLLRGATVINIVSDAAWRPMRHSLAYNCSKAALAMATKQMARELTKPCGLSVVGINPGKMSGTGMSHYIDQTVCEMRGWTPEQARDYFVAGSVTGLEISPEAVASLIYELVHSGLIRNMSGSCVDLVG